MAAPGVQVLQGDNQIFNGAPSNYNFHCVSVYKYVLTQGKPNPTFLSSLKASTSASLGQPNGENSTVEKRFERTTASYNSHGEVNESLKLRILVQFPDLYFFFLRFLYLGILFYVEVKYLIWSEGWVASSNLKCGRRLQENIGGNYKNSGSPDGRKPWGDGGLVVVRNFNKILVKGSRSVSTRASLPTGLDKLGNLITDNLKNTFLINTKMLSLLSDKEILMAAYTKINKSSPENLTPGINKENFDGLDSSWFDKLSKDLHTNKYQFRPAKKLLTSLEIPKAYDKGTRPLGIASPKDKIIQNAILLILEAIFEPTFSTHSHGFRPQKGCHSALKEIKRTFTSVNWFLAGDLGNCFDSFDHKILIKLISKKIDDKGFMDLLHKALRAGYLFKGQSFSPDVGTPQGSPIIISPILCNILLNELDNYIENLRGNFEEGKRHNTNPLWRKLTGQHKLIHKQNISSIMYADPGYKRLKYVRYAGYFLIGVTGSKEDCFFIRDQIFSFLKDLKLDLNLGKTKISHARSEMAHFLGTDIKITPLNKRPRKLVTRENSTYMVNSNTRLQLLAPVSDLVAKLETKGLARHGGKPTRWGKMLHFELAQIVNHYKTMWRGISNYYSFADNYERLGRIHYIFKYSCILTIASKLNLNTAKKVFKKFGKDITIIVDNKKVASFPNENLAKPKKFNNSAFANTNPLFRLEKLTKATFRTKQMFD